MLEVRVRGVDEAIRALEKFEGPAYAEGKYKGFRAMAEITRDRAKLTDMFKDKTGKLRRSFRILKKKRRNRDGTEEFEAHLRNTAPHAHLIIYGRRARGTGKKSEPRPFIQKAAAETRNEQLRAAGKAMWDFIGEVARENRSRA